MNYVIRFIRETVYYNDASDSALMLTLCALQMLVLLLLLLWTKTVDK